MRLELSQGLYHKPDCDHPIFSHPRVDAAKVTRVATPEELEDEGYTPCEYCFPERDVE